MEETKNLVYSSICKKRECFMKQVSLENHPSIFQWPEINLSPLVVKISPLQLRSSVFTHRRSFGKTRDWVQSCLSTIGSITHVYSKMTGDYRWVFCANPTSNCRNLDIFTPFSLSERKFYFVWFFHQVRKSRTLKIFVIQHWSFVLFLTSRNGSFFFFLQWMTIMRMHIYNKLRDFNSCMCFMYLSIHMSKALVFSTL